MQLILIIGGLFHFIVGDPLLGVLFFFMGWFGDLIFRL